MSMLDLKVTRTANAGVLLEMDGTTFLLDGVCKLVFPYLGTPGALRERLTENPPDVLAFTHKHEDHCDDSYVQLYRQKTLRSVYGPESLPFYEVGNGIGMALRETRHIGKSDAPHVSYAIMGSSTVWFMGDASPLSLEKMVDLPRPDLLIAPFAYANTPSAWRRTKEIGAWKILLVHMPREEDDRVGLWDMVRSTVGEDPSLLIPDMGQTYCF